MVFEEQDELIDRISAQLRPLPDVDGEAKARVLVAVAAERQRDRERTTRRPRVIAWTLVAGLAATVVFTALLVERGREGPGAITTAPSATAVIAPQAPTTLIAPAVLTSHDVGDAAALRPVQLVFRAPDAKRVSVVGDFTGWDASKAVMTRDSGSGLWTATLALPVGRHVYAFLVDDSVWVRDPRAPSAPDADFGRPGSVLLVGRP
jgi:hypothetical protein